MEEDPIGLSGGLNTYTYVLSNPLLYIDPLGLCVDGLGNPAPCPPNVYRHWPNGMANMPPPSPNTPCEQCRVDCINGFLNPFASTPDEDLKRGGVEVAGEYVGARLDETAGDAVKHIGKKTFRLFDMFDFYDCMGGCKKNECAEPIFCPLDDTTY